MVMDKLAALAVVWGLLLPWAFIGLRVFATYGFYDRLLAGVLGGLAATVSLAYVLAMFGRLDLYWGLYAAVCVLSILLARGGYMVEVRWSSGAWWITLVLALVLLAEAWPVFSLEYPLGWDPTFHLILARKILESNALCTDWRPFEPIPVNYTQGLHVFIALVSQWSGQPAHITFQILHLVFQPLAGLLVLRLALAIFGDLRAGVLALLVYEFLCSHGSFSSYYQWGGLPTELGALFFLAIIWMGLTDRSRRGTALAVLCYGGLVMAHHLSGLIATWVLGFYIAASYVGRVDGVLRVWILRLWPLTLLVYAFYIGPYVVGHFGELGHTDVLHFYDEDLKTGWQVATDLGPVALVLGLLGFLLAMQRADDVRGGFLLSWFAALALGFGLLGYGYRFAAYLIFDEEFTAFTPSRFMTLLAYPLAIYAGYALAELIAIGARRFSLRADMLIAAVVVVVVLASVPEVVRLAGLRSVSEEGVALARRIEAEVLADGFVLYEDHVLNKMQPYHWVTYLTWRRSVYTPIPASENRQLLRQIREEMWQSKISRIQQWVASGETPIYYASVNPQTKEVEIKRVTEGEQ